MEDPLEKFPFKNMQAMVDVVTANPAGVDIGIIARTAGSCYPDTTEVCAMASFIGHHGRVVHQHGAWSLVSCPGNTVGPGRFRRQFIAGVEGIISALQRGTVDAPSVAALASMDVETATKYLHFLEQLTRDGFIEKVTGSTKYRLVGWQK